MKILYLECGMGASGDMIISALADAINAGDSIAEEINRLGLKDLEAKFCNVKKAGIRSGHLEIRISGEKESEVSAGKQHGIDTNHHDVKTTNHADMELKNKHEHGAGHHCGHNAYSHILNLLNSMDIDENVKRDAAEIYGIIADAESKVHGTSIDKIHFHEVGELDAIADILGAATLFNSISADKVIVSPINTGRGKIECAHGVMSVPAPATAEIIKGMQVYSDEIEGELLTPTGAAILKYYADEQGSMPPCRLTSIGVGAGDRDLIEPNVVRAFIGESIQEGEELKRSRVQAVNRQGEDKKKNDALAEDSESEPICESACDTFKTEKLLVLETDIDDMTPENIASAVDGLRKVDGVKDVFVRNVQMKKNRQGTEISCLIDRIYREKVLRYMFKHLSTIGIREFEARRHSMDRIPVRINANGDKIDIKVSDGYGSFKVKLEHDDLKKISEKTGLSIKEVYRAILSALKENDMQ